MLSNAKQIKLAANVQCAFRKKCYRTLQSKWIWQLMLDTNLEHRLNALERFGKQVNSATAVSQWDLTTTARVNPAF
jgi:hypothetical protein